MWIISTAYVEVLHEYQTVVMYMDDFEEIVSMDVEYIKNWSLKRDIEIILKTVQVVLHSDGAR